MKGILLGTRTVGLGGRRQEIGMLGVGSTRGL